MISKKFLIQPLAVAALMCAAGASQAALTVYTSAAAFAAATVSPGVDTFTDLSLSGTTTSPITRSAGSYTYTASVDLTSFYGAGSGADPWLSTNGATDTVTFSSFTGSPAAIGGNFFASDIDGSFVIGSVTLVATDSLGDTSTQTITGASTSSFLGFVSTGSVTSLTLVVAVQPAGGNTFIWPTVDNLTLASVSAVPEPQTCALMLAGLGVMGFVASRRRS